MTDVLRVAEIDNLLGHVFGVVGNAFETFSGNHPVKAAANYPVTFV
jgi:hypothetical protein